MRLQGKVAIVTGGARGIGRAESVALAREGAAVIVNDFGDVNIDESLVEFRANRVRGDNCDTHAGHYGLFDGFVATKFDTGLRQVFIAFE